MDSIELIISEVDTDPSEIHMILEEIIAKVLLPPSEEGGKRSRDLLIEPPPNKKKKPDEETGNTVKEYVPVFELGQRCGSNTIKRSRTRFRPKRKHAKHAKPTLTPAPVVNPHLDIVEQIFVNEARLSRLFILVNPYEVKQRIFKKVREQAEPKYDFTGKKYSLITLILPLLTPKRLTYTLAYLNLLYFAGDFFDWQIKLRQITQAKLKTAATVTLAAVAIPPLCDKQSIVQNKYYNAVTNKLYEKNQKVRWAFKRLVNIWLLKKSKRRLIGDDVDLVTLEKIPVEEQIRVLCLSSRSTYVFSGATLIKSFLSNLGTQVSTISCVKPPKNPFTNLPFTHAQLLHIFNEIAGWCYRHNKPYPTIFAMLREAQFKITNMQNLHTNYIQYRATKTYIMDDDISGEFFFENLEVLFDSYSIYLVPFNAILDTEAFRSWHAEEPQHYLLQNWKQLVCDYWHYKQSEHFIREHWKGEMSILYDIELLLKASDSILRYYA